MNGSEFGVASLDDGFHESFEVGWRTSRVQARLLGDLELFLVDVSVAVANRRHDIRLFSVQRAELYEVDEVGSQLHQTCVVSLIEQGHGTLIKESTLVEI